MSTISNDNVDYRLLNRLNKLVICSRCLRAGRITPIPQVFSSHHRPRNVCQSCRGETAQSTGVSGHRRKLAKVLKLER